MSRLEVEQRALLTPTQRGEVLSYMRTIGEIKQIGRVMIDFSGNDRTHTVMLRINNSEQELVFKSGKLAEESRREDSVQMAPDAPLEDSLSYLAIMGYTNAIVCRRDMSVVETADLEYSVRDTISHLSGARMATLFEVEALEVIAGQEQTALQLVDEAVKARGVTPLTEDEWEAWVKQTHQLADQPFEYSPENARQLAGLLAETGWL